MCYSIEISSHFSTGYSLYRCDMSTCCLLFGLQLLFSSYFGSNISNRLLEVWWYKSTNDNHNNARRTETRLDTFHYDELKCFNKMEMQVYIISICIFICIYIFISSRRDITHVWFGGIRSNPIRSDVTNEGGGFQRSFVYPIFYIHKSVSCINNSLTMSLIFITCHLVVQSLF